jgi:hypothetical protein
MVFENVCPVCIIGENHFFQEIIKEGEGDFDRKKIRVGSKG